MKLYTEEQVSEIFKHSQMLSDCNEHRYSTIEYLLADNNITPIELPSDEEIRMQTQFATNDFYWGAKWMKEQILNQNK